MNISDAISREGAVRVASLEPHEVDDVMTYLRAQPLFLGCHVRHGTGPAVGWDQRATATVACWDMHDVIRAPHLLEMALGLTDCVASYLGVDVPTLYSINAFITQPGSPIRPDIQAWHRDADDIRFLPLFVFLTDVGDDAAQEIRGPGFFTHITGSRGTAFFSNTMEEHQGLKPQHSERILWWARWGISDPPASYQWDHLTPMSRVLLGERYPTDLRLQQSIRLVVA